MPADQDHKVLVEQGPLRDLRDAAAFALDHGFHSGECPVALNRHGSCTCGWKEARRRLNDSGLALRSALASNQPQVEEEYRVVASETPTWSEVETAPYTLAEAESVLATYRKTHSDARIQRRVVSRTEWRDLDKGEVAG